HRARIPAQWRLVTLARGILDQRRAQRDAEEMAVPDLVHELFGERDPRRQPLDVEKHGTPKIEGRGAIEDQWILGGRLALDDDRLADQRADLRGDLGGAFREQSLGPGEKVGGTVERRPVDRRDGDDECWVVVEQPTIAIGLYATDMSVGQRDDLPA